MQDIHLSQNKTKYFLSSGDLLNAVDKLGKKVRTIYGHTEIFYDECKIFLPGSQ